MIQLQPPDSGEAGLEAEIYVLVSNHTHSSANWFATIVQENEVGTIVGEPTGNPAGHFGDVLLFETPITHLQFSVSHKHFSPPSGDPADYVRTLGPDVIVETTIEDVLGGFDRQLAYVIDRHRRSLAAPDR